MTETTGRRPVLFRFLVSGTIGSIFLFQIVNKVFVPGGVISSAMAIVTNFHENSLSVFSIGHYFFTTSGCMGCSLVNSFALCFE